MILGVGTDLVENRRIEQLLLRWGDRFLNRTFTARELAYCLSRSTPALHLAARWACKEAFYKALPKDALQRTPTWREVEVRRDPDGRIRLSWEKSLRDNLRRGGITRSHVSLSHARDHSMAVVVLEGKGG